MFMIVSGESGAGKSTICRQVASFLTDRGISCGGVVCEKTERGDIIAEDVGSGERVLLAWAGSTGGLHVGKYSFDPAAIKFAAGAIERGRDSAVLFVDELGPLELAGGGIVKAVDLIHTGQARHCLAVIRPALVPAFMPLLARPARVFVTTMDNRVYLPRQIGALFANAVLAQAPVLST